MGFTSILSQQREGRGPKIVLGPYVWVPDTVYSKIMGAGRAGGSKLSRADTHQNYTGLVPMVSLTALFIIWGYPY